MYQEPSPTYLHVFFSFYSPWFIFLEPVSLPASLTIWHLPSPFPFGHICLIKPSDFHGTFVVLPSHNFSASPFLAFICLNPPYFFPSVAADAVWSDLVPSHTNIGYTCKWLPIHLPHPRNLNRSWPFEHSRSVTSYSGTCFFLPLPSYFWFVSGWLFCPLGRNLWHLTFSKSLISRTLHRLPSFVRLLHLICCWQFFWRCFPFLVTHLQIYWRCCLCSYWLHSLSDQHI